ARRRHVAGRLAGARARRTIAARGAEPPRSLGADGYDAVRAGPALFAPATRVAPARGVVHAGRLARGAVVSADFAALDVAHGAGLGARGLCAVAAVARRAYRGSDQAGVA